MALFVEPKKWQADSTFYATLVEGRLESVIYAKNIFSLWNTLNILSKISKIGKIGRLSVIPVGTTSIVIVGHFFGDPKGLNKFRWSRTKIRGTLYWELGVPNHPRNRWKWAKNDKNGSKSKFPRCPIFKFFVVTREVIPEKMPPILDSMNFFWVLTPFRPQCPWFPVKIALWSLYCGFFIQLMGCTEVLRI